MDHLRYLPLLVGDVNRCFALLSALFASADVNQQIRFAVPCVTRRFHFASVSVTRCFASPFVSAAVKFSPPVVRCAPRRRPSSCPEQVLGDKPLRRELRGRDPVLRL